MTATIPSLCVRRPSWRLSALLVLLVPFSCGDPPDPIQDVTVEGGEQALEILMKGNERFVAEQPLHLHASRSRRAILASGQDPYAIVLGCADSRVAPELLFDTGLGDIFVVRVAGNLPGGDEVASIEYAVEHLNTPLVLVLGHEGCGAVTAAIGEHDDELPELYQLLEGLAHVKVGMDDSLPLDARVAYGVEANVRYTVNRLRELHDGHGDAGHEPVSTLFQGAVYELETGRVRLIDSESIDLH